MIPVAAIYVFLILAFLVPGIRWVFWAVLGLMLLAYFYWPSGQNDLANQVFTNLTWVALALVILAIILLIVGYNVASDKISDILKRGFSISF